MHVCHPLVFIVLWVSYVCAAFDSRITLYRPVVPVLSLSLSLALSIVVFIHADNDTVEEFHVG